MGPSGPGGADGNSESLAPSSADSYHSAGILSPANSDLHLLISGNVRPFDSDKIYLQSMYDVMYLLCLKIVLIVI